jgi:hypothetical protein
MCFFLTGGFGGVCVTCDLFRHQLALEHSRASACIRKHQQNTYFLAQAEGFFI